LKKIVFYDKIRTFQQLKRLQIKAMNAPIISQIIDFAEVSGEKIALLDSGFNNIIFANTHFLKLAGYHAGQFPADILNFFSEAEHNKLSQHISHNKDVSVPGTFIFCRNGGQPLYVKVKLKQLSADKEIVLFVEEMNNEVLLKMDNVAHQQQSIINFSNLADFIPKPFFEADINGDIKYINKEGLSAFNYSIDDYVTGLNLQDFISHRQHWVLEDTIGKIKAGRDINGVGFTGVKKNKLTFEFTAHLSPVYNNGAVCGIRGMLLDITDQRKKATTINKLFTAVEQAANSIMITNSQGIIEYVNNAFLENTEFEISEVIGKTPAILNSGKHTADFFQEMWRRLLRGEIFHEEVINRKKSGKLYYEEKVITPIKNEIGVVTHFIDTGRDITAQKLAARKFETISKLKSLQKEKEQKIRSWAILKGQEEERKRLSRDIHDGLGQMLYGIQLKIDDFIYSGKYPETITGLKEVSQMLGQTMGEASRVAHDLMPNVLNDFGLLAAVHKMAAQLSVFSGAAIEVYAPDTLERFEPMVEVALYRIIQEAVKNSIRHGKASSISIDFERVKKSLHLCIRDNGQGFDTGRKNIPTSESIGGKGIPNMKERALLIGGSFNITSMPDQGTVIIISIPNKNLKWKRK
jgi:PAS domain S-box-containing protein